MELLSELLLNAGGLLLQSILAGCALTIVVRLAMLPVAGHLNATTRYTIWLITLLAVSAMPLWLLLPRMEQQTQVTREDRKEPAGFVLAATNPEVQIAEPVLAIEPVEISVDRDGVLALAILWPAGTLLSLLFVAHGYRKIRALKASARPAAPEALTHWAAVLDRWPGDRVPELLSTADAASPMAVGYLRPAVLLPESLLLTLRGDELDAILLHELAHIRRHDDQARLFQAVLRSFWFFHPAIHYICRRLDLEREFACDDTVLAHLGHGRDYARSLTTLLEQQRGSRMPHPALASGAAFHRKQIVQRVSAILDGTRNRLPSISPVGLVVVLACGAGLAANIVDIPALFELVEFQNGRTFRSEWQSGDRHEYFEVRGDWEIVDDQAPLESLHPGTVVRIGEGDWVKKTFEFRRTPEGELEVVYKIGGREQRMDAALRRRAKDALSIALRDSGFDASARAERLLAAGGVSAVLADADRSKSDHVRSEYLRVLLHAAPTPDTDLPRILSRVGRLGDDHGKAEILLSLLERDVNLQTLIAIADTVRSIQGDSEKDRVVSALIDRTDLLSKPDLRKAVLRATDSVQDSGVRAELLLTMIRSRQASEATLADIAVSAARIEADEASARVLDQIAQGEIRPELASKVASAAAALNDDVQKANVVVRLTAYATSDAFLNAVRSIRADAERIRVLRAVLERNASPEALRSVAELANTVGSDAERAHILIELASRRQPDAQLTKAIRRAAGRIVSPDEYRSVLRAVEAQ